MSVLNTIGAASIRGFQNPDVINGPILLQKLTNPFPPPDGGNFGFSIDSTTDGSRIIVGAVGTINIPAIGRAHIYVLSGGIWVLEQSLTDGTVNQRFGFDVAISEDGNYCIVGAPGGTAPNIGKAYVYARSGSTWSLVYTTAVAGSRAGECVCINADGSYAAYGSPTFSSSSGKITILSRTGGVFSVQQTFASLTEGQKFGSSISINDNGDRIVIGSDGLSLIPAATLRTGSTWATPNTFSLGGSGAFTPVAISNDGQYVIAGVNPGILYKFNSGISRFDFLYQPVFSPLPYNAVPPGDISINNNGTEILAGGSYYAGLDSSWSLIQNYFVNFSNSYGTTNNITANGQYLIFGNRGENIEDGAVYIF